MMTKHRLAGVLVTALAATQLAQAASDQPADYAAVAPINTASPEGLQRLHLPLPVLQQSRSATLADLRVFNAKQESLAFSVLAPQTESTVHTAGLPLFAWPKRSTVDPSQPAGLQVQVDAAGAIVRINGAAPIDKPAEGQREWLLDATARTAEDRLVSLLLEWERSDKGFSTSVQVEGSNDFNTWQPLARTALVDLPSASGHAVLQNRIAIDETARTWKYLRLRADDAFALRTVRAEWRSSREIPLDHAPAVFVRTDDPLPMWQLDLQGRVALRRLRIDLPQPNTVAILQLEQRVDGSNNWRAVSTQTIYRLNRSGQELISPPMEIAAPAARHWRLKLDARSPALDLAQLHAELQWPRQWLVFAARGPAPLSLAVGRTDATAKALPLTALLPGDKPADAEQLPEATVGAVTMQALREKSLVEQFRGATPEDRRRWLLWSVLGAAVAGLFWLAMSLKRDMAKAPSEPN